MAARPQEQIWIETSAGAFDRFRAIEVSTDLFGEASATVEVADDRSWRTLRRLLQPAQSVAVYANGLIVFTGRIDAHELPTSVDDGTVTQLVLRTRLADTRIGSADSSVRTQDTTIRDFILALYAKHGFTPADFLFTPETDRDLVTGKKAGKAAPVDLEPLKADQAKVLATETTDAAAKRHLERHHLMLWESATGLICVGLPSDTQPPFYRFEQRDGVCNFRQARPVRDWSEIPSELWVHGGIGVGRDATRASVRGVAVDYDLVLAANSTGHFNRRVILANEGAKDLARANAQARRELAARSRRKAAWEIEADDWSFWDGSRATPYAINTTCDVDVETHEGSDLRGTFLVTGVRKRLSVDEGPRTVLTTMAKGLIDAASNP